MTVTPSLFSEFCESSAVVPIPVVPGMVYLPKFVQSESQFKQIAPSIRWVCEQSPVRHMRTRRGQKIQVPMTNCGKVGWVSDSRGYRYSAIDPLTDKPWPAMPITLKNLATNAAKAAGFTHFEPDACLINRYAPGVQMGAHQDRDEQDFDHPIVSVSLGIPARFFVLGLERGGRSTPVDLNDGDVVVFGGPARLFYHGVRKLKPNIDPFWGEFRWNLTFRKAL